MADFPVYSFHEGLRGAPQLSGTAGALISVFDACLITGFGTVSVTDITVADGVATCTVNSGDTFEAHHIIEIDGASPSELNGRHRVLPGATQTKFEFETNAASGTASGTITAKYAAAEGWEKAFSGTHKAVYRATTGHRFYYRIDDDFTQKYVAEIRGYETMSDVDTGTGPFPPLDVTSVLEKTNGNNANLRRWDLNCDGRFVHFGAKTYGDPAAADIYGAPARGFGEAIALAPNGDSFGSIVASARAVSTNTSQGDGGAFALSYASGAAPNSVSFAARSFSGIGSASPCSSSNSSGGSSVSGATSVFGVMPSAVNGAIYLDRVYAREFTTQFPRLIIPGFFFVPQDGFRDMFVARDVVVPPVSDLGGRRLRALYSGGGNSSTSNSGGGHFIDTTGPWRQ